MNDKLASVMSANKSEGKRTSAGIPPVRSFLILEPHGDGGLPNEGRLLRSGVGGTVAAVRVWVRRSLRELRVALAQGLNASRVAATEYVLDAVRG